MAEKAGRGVVALGALVGVVALGAAAIYLATSIADPGCWGTIDSDIYVSLFTFSISVTGCVLIPATVWASYRLGARALALLPIWFAIMAGLELAIGLTHGGDC